MRFGPGTRTRAADRAADRAVHRITSLGPLRSLGEPQLRARGFFTPRWLLFHLLVWGAVIAMALLGRWQLLVSNSKHFALQNFGYTLQWWAFALCGALFWFRVVSHARHPPAPPPSSSGELAVVTGGGQLVPVGPTALVTRPSPDREPTVYRGYVMPSAATAPIRSEDAYQGSFNDYLWQLALADGEAVPQPASTSGAAGAHAAGSVDDTPIAGEQTAPELEGDHRAPPEPPR